MLAALVHNVKTEYLRTRSDLNTYDRSCISLCVHICNIAVRLGCSSIAKEVISPFGIELFSVHDFDVLLAEIFALLCEHNTLPFVRICTELLIEAAIVAAR